MRCHFQCFPPAPSARVCVALDRVRKSDWREGAVYCFKIESFNCPACLALPAATAGAAQLVKQELSTWSDTQEGTSHCAHCPDGSPPWRQNHANPLWSEYFFHITVTRSVTVSKQEQSLMIGFIREEHPRRSYLWLPHFFKKGWIDLLSTWIIYIRYPTLRWWKDTKPDHTNCMSYITHIYWEILTLCVEILATLCTICLHFIFCFWPSKTLCFGFQPSRPSSRLSSSCSGRSSLYSSPWAPALLCGACIVMDCIAM